MCGIAGILLDPRFDDPARLASVQGMATRLRHRGPDGEGLWTDHAAGIALAHRRLAIVDLSEAGRQPMQSHDGSLVMTFNGEVYNFPELRSEMEALGHPFRGHSDTEVMLAAFESFGIVPALKRFAGMFALAVWDRKQRALHLARDRMGKKPLFVAVSNGALLFASELKSLHAFPGFMPTLDLAAAGSLLRQGWIPEHQCIWNGVIKLPPGSVVTVRPGDLRNADSGTLRKAVRQWWSLADVAKEGQAQPLKLTELELELQLTELLKTAVRERMVADVPLGAFLSGGIDSSVVVALMQAQSSRAVKTFTIGFAEAGFDEGSHAAKVAHHLGTDHTEFRVTPKEARGVIPELGRIWDEPFADDSQIPTLLLARLARTHVTVALSGDGGDECFGGYTRHIWSSRLATALKAPAPFRRLAGAGLLGMANLGTWTDLASRPVFNQQNAQRISLLLDAADERDLYDRLIRLDPAGRRAVTPDAETDDMPPLSDTLSRFMYRDMAGYLPSNILVKLDRATMAVALEGRCPLLDHRLVEFAWGIPSAQKVRGGVGKRILRRVLERQLPEKLFDRPKQGFSLPIGAWLVGPLRDWAHDVLDPSRQTSSGLLDPDVVAECWQSHTSGSRDRSRELWAMLMLETWFDDCRSSDTASWTNATPTGGRNTKVALGVASSQSISAG